MKLLQENPADPAIHHAMAQQASHTGRPGLALEHMTAAFQLAPHSLELGFQLGCLQAHAGEFGKALVHFQAATTHWPAHADAWYFQGIALSRLHRDTEALPALRNAYRLAPGRNNVLKALADSEFKAGYPADALPLWQELNKLDPGNIDAWLKTGETLSRLGFQDEAIAHYHAALGRLPGAADLWLAMAQAQEDKGEKAAAQQAYEQALAIKPGWALPMSGLLGLLRGKASPELAGQAIALQASSALTDAERALIGYELGKVHDGRGEYAQAISSWHDANSARRRMIGAPDLSRLNRDRDTTIRLFQPEVLARLQDAGSQDTRPVFIVGMPRSGTTLTEQIIASHPLAHGCGELPDIALIVRNLPAQLEQPLAWPDLIPLLRGESLQQPIRRYLEAVTRHAPADALRLVDKAPLNFFHLGLIALMFPQARVIWCRRDPRDIAVSIYGENFSLDEKLATDLAGIGHYINTQTRLMRHWQSVLPLPILELGYEALVSDIEAQSKALISFTGLPWDPACLDFHQSDRGVQTPSRWQVKQPVHTRSIGRWRNYSDQLAPLIEALEPGSY